MTIGTVQLSEAQQGLIDARLDTIDRMLLGRISRRDRVAIVREVESQIFELLHDRYVEELTREDVLAVLGRLDPPEAYMPEDEEGESIPRRVPPTPSVHRTVTESNKTAKLARGSGALGLASIAAILFCPAFIFMSAWTESTAVIFIVWAASVLFLIAASAAGLVLGIIGRRAGPWAWVGIVTSVLSIPFALGGAMFLIANLASL